MRSHSNQSVGRRPSIYFCILSFLIAAPPALAQLVDAVPIFTGEAQTGDGRRIPGTVTFVVRVTSNDGPIQALDFTGFHSQLPSVARGVQGRSCQRWISSQGNGDYDTATPGFSTIRNLMGEESLDTHFLFDGNADHFTITTPLTETGIRFHGGNPVPSTPAVGYGLGGQAIQPGQGLVQGAWDLVPPAQTTMVDAIYVVAGGSVGIAGRALTQSGWSEFQFGVSIPTVPEPMGSFAIALTLFAVHRHPRR